MDLDLDNLGSYNAFEQATMVTHPDGSNYWRKTDTGAGDHSVDMWNRLYNPVNGQLLRFKNALRDGQYNYFPDIGVAIPAITPEQQRDICKIVHEKLTALGLFHDEVNPTRCNLLNVRMIQQNGIEFYPIDMTKIYNVEAKSDELAFMDGLDFDGGKKRKTRQHKRKNKRKTRKNKRKTI